jgi:dipeptide/tripeptide permease
MDDIEDVRLVLRVCVLFIPISMYYALSNQQGSRWTYQASLMDGRIVRIFLWKMEWLMIWLTGSVWDDSTWSNASDK